MNQLLKLKPRAKKAKPSAIQNYRVSYLDKKSKTYHRIVMTAFTGLFGLVGVVYVFSSSAASNNNSSQTNASNLPLLMLGLAVLLGIVLIAYFLVRKK